MDSSLAIVPALFYLSNPHHTQVVAKFPPTLWLSEENLQSKLNFLSESLNLDGSELRSIIVSYPQILGLSLQNNLRHKMDFFLDASVQVVDPATLLLPGDKSQKKTNGSINCGLSRNQLKEFVIYQPALLAYSLENRLKPRIPRIQEKNNFFVSALDLTNERMPCSLSCRRCLPIEGWLVTLDNRWLGWLPAC